MSSPSPILEHRVAIFFKRNFVLDEWLKILAVLLQMHTRRIREHG
jgi:hypothetical protein